MLYLMVVTGLVATLIWNQTASSLERWELLNGRVARLQRLAGAQASYLHRNRQVADLHRNCDGHYLRHKLEPVQLLRQRSEELSKLVAEHPYVDQALRERLHLWKSDQNRLHFLETNRQEQGAMLEACQVLAHPVELDGADLNFLLEQIEGPYSSESRAPQLLITELLLEKKGQGEQNEVLQLDLKVLKRDFI
jgi:hypothetical protein